MWFSCCVGFVIIGGKEMELKDKLITLRNEKGLSQLTVAEALDVSRQAVSRW